MGAGGQQGPQWVPGRKGGGLHLLPWAMGSGRGIPTIPSVRQFPPPPAAAGGSGAGWGVLAWEQRPN